MTNDSDRDEVLIAFHDECELPTPADVERWSALHPHLAKEIREHAAIRIAVFAEADETSADVDDLTHARGRSRLQDAIYNARRDVGDIADPVTFDQLASTASISQPDLARKLDIKRGIVADLFSGRMLKPRPGFRSAVSRELRISPGQFDRAYETAVRRPALGGRAKSHGQPTVNQRSFDDIVRTSGMDPERIRFWLEED